MNCKDCLNMKHKGKYAKCVEGLLINYNGDDMTFKQSKTSKVMRTNFIAWYQRDCMSFDDMDEEIEIPQFKGTYKMLDGLSVRGG